MSKYLKKKGHEGGLERDRSIAPMQGRQGPMASTSMGPQHHESLNNTKAPSVTHVPQGIPHAKKVSRNDMKHGEYL